MAYCPSNASYREMTPASPYRVRRQKLKRGGGGLFRWGSASDSSGIKERGVNNLRGTCPFVSSRQRPVSMYGHPWTAAGRHPEVHPFTARAIFLSDARRDKSQRALLFFFFFFFFSSSPPRFFFFAGKRDFNFDQLPGLSSGARTNSYFGSTRHQLESSVLSPGPSRRGPGTGRGCSCLPEVLEDSRRRMTRV